MGVTYYTARDVVEAFVGTEILPVARTWDERRKVGGRDVSCGCAVVALAASRGVSLAAHPDRGVLPPLILAQKILEGDAFFLRGMADGWDAMEPGAPAYVAPVGAHRWREGYRQGRKARRWIDRFGGRYGLAVR